MSVPDITPVLMPKWGLSMEEGELSSWLVEEGAQISVGDEIMEVETDKIASVVEATDGGILRRCVGKEGEIYPVSALLGVLAPTETSDDEIDAFIESFIIPDEADESGETPQQYMFADTAAGRIRYAQRGENGPTVLLIHGFGGDLDNWLFNIDALANKTRVFALDLPGHGQSIKQSTGRGLDGLAAAVHAFMDEVGIDQAHLIGHSMGAAVAATLAIGEPERVSSLTLIAAAGLAREINYEYIDGFITSASRRELKQALLTLFANTDLVSRSLVDDVLKYKRIDGVSEALTKLAQELFPGKKQSTVLADKIDELGLKTLLIWGAEDQVIPVAHARKLKEAQREIIHKVGHMVQMEAASTVNSLILAHIGE